MTAEKNKFFIEAIQNPQKNNVFMTILDNPGLTMKDILAENRYWQRSNLSAFLKKWRIGEMIWTETGTDKRKKLYYLSEEAKELLQQYT